MEPPSTLKAHIAVDVTGLLCAQALMVVMKAIKEIASGGTLDITFNSDDVQRDLSTWATELGHAIVSLDDHDLTQGGRLVVRKQQTGSAR